jgi:hypothetical protein
MNKKTETHAPVLDEKVPGKLGLERLADMTRRMMAVKKSELPKVKPKKRTH